MNKNFAQIVDNIQLEIQDTSSAIETLIKNYVNRRYFQVLRAVNWENIRPDYTFDTTAGTSTYILPDDFGKETMCVDTTNKLEIAKIDYQKFLMEYTSRLTDTGSPTVYYVLEDTVRTQPTAASVVTLVSSSASDTAIVVLVRGIVAGVETSESVTLTGTTPVATTGSFTRVIAISKSGNSVGYVTATSNSAAVTLTVLAPKINEARCKKIGLFPIPSSSVTVQLPYITKPLPMTEDYDYPVLDCADLLEIGAQADGYRYKRQFAKAQNFEIIFNSLLADFIFEKENHPNQIIQFTPKTFNKDNLY